MADVEDWFETASSSPRERTAWDQGGGKEVELR